MDRWHLFSLDWKRLILPALAGLVMISAIGGLYNIRMSGIDERATDETRQRMLNVTEAFGEEEFYNITAEPPSDTESAADIWLEDPVNRVSAGSLFLVYRTPLFFLEPGGSVLLPGQSFFLKASDGYYLSRETPESIIKIMYQASQVRKMNEKASNDSLTLEEWRQGIDDLRDIEVNDTVAEEVSRMNTSEVNAGGAGFINSQSAPELADTYLEEGFKEVGWHHFIPGIATTIIIWYFVNSVLVELVAAIRELV